MTEEELAQIEARAKDGWPRKIVTRKFVWVNAAFIASSREDIPVLIAALREAWQERDAAFKAEAFAWADIKAVRGTSIVNPSVMLLDKNGKCIGIVHVLNAAEDNVRFDVERALGSASNPTKIRRYLNAARNGEAEANERAEKAEAERDAALARAESAEAVLEDEKAAHIETLCLWHKAEAAGRALARSIPALNHRTLEGASNGDAAIAENDATARIIGDFMLVPPDGGDLKLHEGVQRMRDALTSAEAERDALRAQVATLREALGWYGENARLCRLIHSGGDIGRKALDEDGGEKARGALATKPEDTP